MVSDARGGGGPLLSLPARGPHPGHTSPPVNLFVNGDHELAQDEARHMLDGTGQIFQAFTH